VAHDTWQLFYDMNHYNPYAKEKRAAFMQAMKKINNQLER
jgi:prephenate dehydrogenase